MLTIPYNNLPMGATLAPVILASDSTKLSVLGGDNLKTAWPVYLSLANIAKHV